MTEGEQNQLITENMRLVSTIAADFRGRELEFEDLQAAGRLGLVEGARKFEGRFENFRADGYIRNAIWTAVRSAESQFFPKETDSSIPPSGADSIEKIFEWDSWGNRGNAEAICERWSRLDASPEDLSILFDDIKDKRAKFQAAFISLNGNQRKLVSWVFLDEMPITQAASELGVSYFRAIRMLKKALKTMREVITRMESKTNSGGNTANGRPKYSLTGLHGCAPGTNAA